MSGERWPPVKKAVEECPHYVVLEPYLSPFDFEIDPLLYPFDNVLPLHMCEKFLKQVRESWGYDVNVRAPGSPFYPASSLDLKEKGDAYQKYVVPECKSVVDEINNEAKVHGKFYVFDELKKAVEVPGFRFSLITFSVREVSSNKLERVRVCYSCITIVQWSFKEEGEDEDDYEDGDVFWLPAWWSSQGRWIRA